jgi:D-arabinose 1-dehydrogenase-like Zn-dependent alcohol dehydrogenase
MKAAQISKPGGDWELVEREIPQPDVGQVRVRVEACGVCHSDMFIKEGFWPGIQYPRVPGHEVAGRIDVLGTGVTGWENGQRVRVSIMNGAPFPNLIGMPKLRPIVPTSRHSPLERRQQSWPLTILAE